MNSKDKDHVVRSSVRDFRQRAGLTQEELAGLVDVTRQTVISIEKGNYVPSVLLAMRIADALNTTVNEVFSYDKK